MRRARQSGASLFEAVLFIPIMAMLLWGTIEFARITWTYYTLQKILYTTARYASSQTGVNFCDEGDPIVTDAKNLATRGVGDTAGDLILANLTPDLITVRLERIATDNPQLGECDCSSTGCDIGQGGRGPDFVVVTIPDGYSVRTNIPFFPNETFLLRPVVRVPYGSL
ncbi:MAG: pilus assembly protein [Acidobacteria bacterium]|nr:pilus assembly protein [Acidobacteriota bacterium]